MIDILNSAELFMISYYNGNIGGAIMNGKRKGIIAGVIAAVLIA